MRAEVGMAEGLLEQFLDTVPAFVIEYSSVADLVLQVYQKLGIRKGAEVAKQVARRAKIEAERRGRYTKEVHLSFYDQIKEYNFVANKHHTGEAE